MRARLDTMMMTESSLGGLQVSVHGPVLVTSLEPQAQLRYLAAVALLVVSPRAVMETILASLETVALIIVMLGLWARMLRSMSGLMLLSPPGKMLTSKSLNSISLL